MVDITRHKDQQLNALPNDLQARVKMRWDDEYFYVGALLNEAYITAQNVGHNNHAPYSPDNDFEIFIDVSGTTQYYMEFEMSVQNSTYDIKWGKPDGTSLACDNSGASWPALPTCVNTSFRGYAGNWTMATKLHPGPPTPCPPQAAQSSCEACASSTAAAHGRAPLCPHVLLLVGVAIAVACSARFLFC